MLPLELERHVRDLHDRYIRVIDDDRLEDWPGLFTPDALYTITTQENHTRGLPLALLSCRGQRMMQDRVTGLRRINVFEPHRYHHQLSGLQCVLQENGVVRCTSGFLVVRTMHTGTISIFATGVYQDVIVAAAGGELRFSERLVITDSRQTDTLLVIPL